MTLYNTHRKDPEKQLNMEKFEITKREGHHDPNPSHPRQRGCACEETTKGGYAYRDIVAERIAEDSETEWDRIRFYHQADVVKKNSEVIEVDTHGYGTSSTTRDRINRELPKGFRLVQRDYEVKLRLPNGGLIDVPENFRIVPGTREVLNAKSKSLICHYVETTD